MLKKSASGHRPCRVKRETCEKGATWTDWIPTSFRPYRSAIPQDYILLPQAYGPLSFWRATTVFPQPARAFLWLGLQQNLLGRQRTFE